MKWVALLSFGLIGLALMVFSAGWGIRRYYLLRHSLRAQGVVVANITSGPSEAEAGCTEVEFHTKDGQTIRIRSTISGTRSAELKPGKTVEVIYDRSRPNDGQIAEFTQTWRDAIGPGAAGLAFFLFGVLAFAIVSQIDRDLGNGQKPDRPVLSENEERVGPKKR
jgi:hypothetical protein